MRLFFALLLTIAITPALQSQQTQSQRQKFVTPPRPVHTFSIVARDPATGELGVAVQSHWFSVGSIVPWAEAGVGAVATQSFVDPSYGKLGLDLMRTGKSGPEALRSLLAGDDGRDVRQVAMIDTQGRVDAWTGKNDIAAAGHFVGKDFHTGESNGQRQSVAGDGAGFETQKVICVTNAGSTGRGPGCRWRHSRASIRGADRGHRKAHRPVVEGSAF